MIIVRIANCSLEKPYIHLLGKEQIYSKPLILIIGNYDSVHNYIAATYFEILKQLC